jgi:hypothetical protein
MTLCVGSFGESVGVEFVEICNSLPTLRARSDVVDFPDK